MECLVNFTKGVGPSENLLDVSYDYNKNGQISTAQFANGTRQSYTYKDADLQSVTHQYAQGTPPFNSYSYEYDNNKNIQSKTTNGQTSSYTYDPLNRIETNSEFSETYTYDSKGNRLSLNSAQMLATNEREFEYDNWERLVKVTNADGSTVTYRYNGDNLLYERTENGQTQRYYWDGDQIAAEATVVGGTPQHKASYIRGNGLVARMASNGTKMYYLTNGHGDVVELRKEDGSLANRYSYDIWGNVLSKSGDAENPFLYSGEYWDEGTKLQYLRARWYDPSMGRFINKDTYEGDFANPLTLNLYAYVGNNPLIHTDSSGHCFGPPYYCQTVEMLQKAKEGITTAGKMVAAELSGPWYPAYNAATGTDFITNQQLSTFDRWMNAISALAYFVPETEMLSSGTSSALSTVARSGSHAVATAEQASSILKGINPKYFNANSRFGGGFYVAQSQKTAVAEVAAHGGDAKYIINYDLNLSGQKVLDLSDPAIAEQWGYNMYGGLAAHQNLATTARTAGYNVIKFPSLRGEGTNYVIYSNFDEILTPTMVVPASN